MAVQLSAEYSGKESFFGDSPPLPEAAGYAIVLGFGAFFSLFTTIMVYMDKLANGTVITSEFFNTAGRNVKTGLTASVIVSQWTWAATLLQSSNVAWNYGVSGPFWYASGATIQVLLFGILAIELKRRARTCHTVCELVYVRWGKAAHLTFIFFCLVANVIVTSMLLLGGAATVNALTGVDTDLASFLIPWGVILYTAAGGLKATFMASYLHTAIIFLVLVVCVYTVYVKEYSSDYIYDSLQYISGLTEAQCQERFSTDGSVSTTFYEAGTYSCGPVVDNNDGSYVTMLSLGGLKFGIINIVGNFGTVFVDQSYWQSAIAAKPASAHKGYLLGGMVWFTIPFALATSLGLAGVALGLPITAGEAGSGLVPPATAVHLFGDFGAVMMATMLFMAITSTGSAEGIAVSSLICYDVYRRYINPNATGSQILMISRVVIVVFGLSMGALGVALNHMGLNLGWVYQFMGNAIGSAVVPLWNVLMWKDANATGAIVAAWGGMILALATWLIICQVEFGEITVDNLGTLNPNLGGNIVALGSSALIHVGFSLASPQNYDFESMGQIEMMEDDQSGLDEADYSPEFLAEAKAWIQKYGWGFTILMVIVWPLLSIPAGVFTKDYWAFWVFISIGWAFTATITIISLPLYESREAILGVFMFMLGRKQAEKAEPAKTETEEKI
jgi:SSS family transporter